MSMQETYPNVSDEEALKLIAYNLKRLRGNVSFAEVARRCGTYPTAIKRIEDGDNMPGVGLLTRIAVALGASFEDFLQPIRKSQKSA